MQIEFCRICKRRVMELDLSMGVAIQDGDSVVCHDCKKQADSDAAQVLDLFESEPKEPTKRVTPARGWAPGSESGVRSGQRRRFRAGRRGGSGVRRRISSTAIPIVGSGGDADESTDDSGVHRGTPSGGTTAHLRARRLGRRPRRRLLRGRKDGQGTGVLIAGLVGGIILILLMYAAFKK